MEYADSDNSRQLQRMAWYENVPAPGETQNVQGSNSTGCINGDKRGLKNELGRKGNKDRVNEKLKIPDFEF